LKYYDKEYDRDIIRAGLSGKLKHLFSCITVSIKFKILNGISSHVEFIWNSALLCPQAEILPV
jgi:hypothetical protein